MIQTQSTAIKRRNSVHKNLFDPSLYQIPEPPRGVPTPKKEYSKETFSNQVFGYDITSLKKRFTQLFPSNIQGYLPEVDLRITIICSIWYVTSSISSNLSKAILRTFNHPIALTELQFLVSAVLCVGFASIVNLFRLPRLKHTKFSKALNSFPDGILPEYLDGNFQFYPAQVFSSLKAGFDDHFPYGNIPIYWSYHIAQGGIYDTSITSAFCEGIIPNNNSWLL